MTNRLWKRRKGDNRDPADAAAGMKAALAPSGGGAADSSADVDLGMLFRILLRQWLLIGVITALFVGAGVAYMKTAPKVWKATARVLLDPRDKQVTGPSLAQPFQGVDIVWIDTQTDLVTSAVNLNAVVDKLDLQHAADFAGSRVETLRKLAESTKVERADQTYVLDVSAFTHSPDQSAEIAQALAEAYVRDTIRSKTEQVRQASALINHQLDELRNAARTAQEKLEAYKREHGLISANGRSVEEDRLRQLNDAYVAAQVKARDAKARREQLAAALKAGSRETALDGIDSPVLSRLKIDAAQAARTVDDLSHQLGPNHPRMLAARANLDQARAQIAAELRSLAAAAVADDDLARSAEEAAKRAVDRASAAVASNDEAGVLLKELENEASLRADMYRSYLQRTAEISLQANTQVSDASVIVPASPPLYPYSPRGIVVLGLAGIAGLGTALSLAIYRGRKYLPQAAAGAGAARATAGPITPAAAIAPPPAQPPAAIAPPPAADTAAAEAVAEADGAEAPILAELSVATAGEIMNRLGRPIARSPRDILSSAFETAGGQELPGARPRLEALVRRIEAERGRARTLMTVGVGEDPAAAAVALALAQLPPADGGGVLLVDASNDRLPLAHAFTDEDLPGIVDVIVEGVGGADAALCPEGTDITLVAAGRLADVDARAGDVAAFVEELTADYGRLIVHVGYHHSLPLMDALVGRADAVLVVGDRAVASDPESNAAIAELAKTMPAFCGLVLVDERAADGRAKSETAAA